MRLREAVYNAIVGDGTVASLISDRCYPDRLPEEPVFPAVVFQARISEDDVEYRTHDRVPVPRATARVQVDAYAETGDQAAELASAIVALFSGYGDGGTIGTVQIANRIDTYEPALNRHRAIVDILVDYER